MRLKRNRQTTVTLFMIQSRGRKKERKNVFSILFIYFISIFILRSLTQTKAQLGSTLALSVVLSCLTSTPVTTPTSMAPLKKLSTLQTKASRISQVINFSLKRSVQTIMYQLTLTLKIRKICFSPKVSIQPCRPKSDSALPGAI